MKNFDNLLDVYDTTRYGDIEKISYSTHWPITTTRPSKASLPLGYEKFLRTVYVFWCDL